MGNASVHLERFIERCQRVNGGVITERLDELDRIYRIEPDLQD
jgi:hypothetical protein